MLELILEAMFNFILVFPGGFVVWAFRGFKGKYLEVAMERSELSAFIGLLLLSVFFLVLLA